MHTIPHSNTKYGILYLYSSGGGTGRRARLRGVWEQSHGGSSPLLSTESSTTKVATNSQQQSEIVGTGRRARYMEDMTGNKICFISLKHTR